MMYSQLEGLARISSFPTASPTRSLHPHPLPLLTLTLSFPLLHPHSHSHHHHHLLIPSPPLLSHSSSLSLSPSSYSSLAISHSQPARSFSLSGSLLNGDQGGVSSHLSHSPRAEGEIGFEMREGVEEERGEGEGEGEDEGGRGRGGREGGVVFETGEFNKQVEGGDEFEFDVNLFEQMGVEMKMKFEEAIGDGEFGEEEDEGEEESEFEYDEDEDGGEEVTEFSETDFIGDEPVSNLDWEASLSEAFTDEPRSIAEVQRRFKQSSYESRLDTSSLDGTLLRSLLDLRYPQSWYSNARRMKRKFIAHVGPTNSGKTHSALTALKNAKTGVYCAPLRLLAAEVMERLNNEGVVCNMATGQQLIEKVGATHTSCTIEMASVTNFVDVAIIDEYQVMVDVNRGWSWTRAILGLPAAEIHLTGDPSKLHELKKLVDLTGEELEIRHYERLSPLQVAPRRLTLNDVQPGDAVIAFSRRNVYKLKKAIEAQTQQQCCVIYGALPPEARAQQAELFNHENNDHNIIVATDCLGMGLNLNIQRVIFSTTSKFDGFSQRSLHADEIKQIAGRAGRYKSKYPTGVVSAFETANLDYVRTAMAQDALGVGPSLPMVLYPTSPQLEMFANHFPQERFSVVFKYFMKNCRLGEGAELAEYSEALKNAQALDDLDMSVEDRLTFMKVPLNTSESIAFLAYRTFARAFCEDEDVPFKFKKMNLPPLFVNGAVKPLSLERYELNFKIADGYLWLAQRFICFSEIEKAERYAQHIMESIAEHLSTALPEMPDWQIRHVSRSKDRKGRRRRGRERGGDRGGGRGEGGVDNFFTKFLEGGRSGGRGGRGRGNSRGKNRGGGGGGGGGGGRWSQDRWDNVDGFYGGGGGGGRGGGGKGSRKNRSSRGKGKGGAQFEGGRQTNRQNQLGRQ